jgi:hypothetical protein
VQFFDLRTQSFDFRLLRMCWNWASQHDRNRAEHGTG